jgi:hypothetical protein
MIPKPAQWMQNLAERLLEHLAESGLSTEEVMRSRPEIGASKARIRGRCLVLAHAESVAPMVPPPPDSDVPDNCEWWELIGAGFE